MAVLKAIIGSIVAVGMTVLTLTMIVPVLVTAKNSVFDTLPNQDNPTNQQMILIGNNAFILIVVIVAVVCGFVVLRYAANRDPFDIS